MNVLINQLIGTFIINMTRISRRILKENLLLKLHSLFFEIMSQYSSKESFLELIDDILSPTEKIMLTKRVAIIYLLIKGVDYRDIANVLKVSTGTVVLYAAKFYKRDSKIVKMIKTMLKKEKFFNFLEDVFADLSIQPGLKIGDWQRYWNHKRRQQERKILP
ncbi:hypothetical protein A3C98_01500 [Candidatus Roizmanbacteria bacterium RIFCSPHIGHO2_02_FULL_37_15]|uniref:Uncharacterized protein n=1 Tax=Candidatus Roizmanbacteria bacterium RIFCSPLOWO2_01_FULL_37_16 TaxID=1802058 RepID=A0A1F7IQK0_9BACT|nr:MAG: hypothetical protein A2859_00405 [Candidatus Roizmanbacteria bacterium RIFCSPHIGHO2_01_FULL_37_16b]OGK21149.1 MAG: hypothetical protein A3C98_01500 [Candidatus Roizmanbacteria bacterium RIFCSPHIGHO2_02_FULL_37_15]OGK45627.1 MAG: hypothetical protein A3B40_00340 [Candidatus Roizmanbacteria bacterium RIFCSPLOWO2_01_FULL_37_16]OGK56639.1 MAG: hypothetical protein A3I50_01205 [Candidatus Roizmanbacteria bacterium RIFCSPLOWO2_02_FULL_37_9]